MALESILRYSNFSQTLEVVVDSRGQDIDGILKWDNNLVIYDSWQLYLHEENYPTHDLELLAQSSMPSKSGGITSWAKCFGWCDRLQELEVDLHSVRSQ